MKQTASTLSWLDFSETERQKTMDIIDMFREQDTRDELGIGTIRDAISEILFPGTGTMQTRIRYFLFIPWLYQSLEEKGVSSENIRNKMRRAELDLIEVLMESGDEDGLIGRRSRGELKRLPSNIYWFGLGRWGIRTFQGSQEAYHRYLDRYYRMSEQTPIKEEEDGVSTLKYNWHPSLPPSPDDFPDKADFKLSKEEAEYLRDRIQTNCPGSLMAWLAYNGIANQDANFAWELPNIGKYPISIQNHIRHARNFSEIMHGSSLLYNLMLAELTNQKDLEQDYRQDLKSWSELIEQRKKDLAEWDQEDFWLTVGKKSSIPFPAKQFAINWIQFALKTPGSMIDDSYSRQLIRNREVALKKGNARLTNQKARDLWNGAAGTRPLDFRWFVAKRQIADICDVLMEK